MYAAGAMMGIRMDMPMMLGTMLLPRGNAALALGMVMHFIAGALFFSIHALLFEAFELDSGLAWWGAIFGFVHGIIAGAMMGITGAIHPRMAAASDGGTAEVAVPGFFGMNQGAMAPVAIIVLHIVFGLVAGALYEL